MTYKTIIAHLGLLQSNSELLRVVGHLRERFDARLIGIAACQPMQLVFGDGYGGGYISPEVTAACQEELEGELRSAEAQFRGAFAQDGHTPAWRSSYTTDALSDYLASEARCADLMVTSVAAADTLDSSRHASLGDLVLRAGRPVLVVPGKAARIPFERIVLAWKDSREARRAVADALPMLKLAKQVTIIEIAAADDLQSAQGRVEDVADWLSHHGITAATLAAPSHGDDASTLDAILAKHDTDLVVAGAYGHSRLREWAFGGVTRNLLQGHRCALLSH